MEGVGLLSHGRRPSNRDKEGSGRSGLGVRLNSRYNKNLKAKKNAGAAANPVSLSATECRRGEVEVSVVGNLS